MSVTANPLTGPIVREPARRTLYCATVLNNCCTWSVVEGWSEAELWEKINEGREKGWYGGTIRELYERKAIHPDDWKAYRAAIDRYMRTTCQMPSEHDLLLRVEAKRLPPERYKEIDPSLADGRQTEAYLKRLKIDLFNETLRRARLGESSTP